VNSASFLSLKGDYGKNLSTDTPRVKEGPDVIGALVPLPEPAGKIRVIAMVDMWTQSILKPLHDFLFSILKTLPNDGTFDQTASVNRCFQKSSVAGLSFGYDLSAATDRLPITFQIAVLSSLIGEELSTIWARILTNRDYYLAGEKPTKFSAGRDGQFLRYAVGQPMGAYSSWAMLAISHHLIVQLAARRSGTKVHGWYDNYELLGDDIILFDAVVAKHYLVLMDELGLTINTSKSVCANNATFEFAKVTGHKGANVSALS